MLRHPTRLSAENLAILTGLVALPVYKQKTCQKMIPFRYSMGREWVERESSQMVIGGYRQPRYSYLSCPVFSTLGSV